jgi:hypothetical protein
MLFKLSFVRFGVTVFISLCKWQFNCCSVGDKKINKTPEFDAKQMHVYEILVNLEMKKVRSVYGNLCKPLN